MINIDKFAAIKIALHNSFVAPHFKICEEIFTRKIAPHCDDTIS